MGIVTISAPYGVGSARIGPAVAAALGLPFVDRAIPLAVAQALGVPLEEVDAQDGRSTHGWLRMIASMAMVPDLAGGESLVYNKVADERMFKEQTERVLGELSHGPGGVILGRCGQMVFRDRPDALLVRLDAPVEARIAMAREHTGESEDVVREKLVTTDRAREAYASNYYKVKLADPKLYHLVIDASVFDEDQITDLIVHAAKVRGVA